MSAAGGFFPSASSIASAATLITDHEISAATGVNGIVLSSLTSILINVPLIRSMTKGSAFRSKVCLGLAMVAVFGLVGLGLNEVISVFAPHFSKEGKAPKWYRGNTYFEKLPSSYEDSGCKKAFGKRDATPRGRREFRRVAPEVVMMDAQSEQRLRPQRRDRLTVQ